MERHDLRHALLILCAAASCVGRPQVAGAAEPPPSASVLQSGLRLGDAERFRSVRLGESAWSEALQLDPGSRLDQESPSGAHGAPDLLGASRASSGERAVSLGAELASHRCAAPGRRLELLPSRPGLQRRGALGLVLGIAVRASSSAKPAQPEGYKDVTDRRRDTFALGGIGARFDL